MKTDLLIERIRWTAILITAIALLSGCRGETAYVEPPPPPVKVTRPSPRDVTNYLEATGNTEATETVEIRARVQGYLDEIKFQAGDEVSAGDILYVIDKRPFVAERNIAAAQVTVAEAERYDAEEKVKRARPLAAEGAVSQEELVEKEAAFEVAKAAIDAAKANLEAAELELSYTEVRTPIDGRVGRTLITKGNLVGGTLATHLTTVIAYDPIYVYFSISESELRGLLEMRERRLEAGEEERVDLSEVPFFMALGAQADFAFEGRLEYADLGVESGTGTYMIRGLLTNDRRLVTPGMFVRVRIPIDELKGALVVPEQAIGFDQRGRFVLIAGAEDVVERKNVTVGRRLGDGFQVVREGLEADDRVIYEGQLQARVGAAVTPSEEPFEPQGEAVSVVQRSEAPASDEAGETGAGETGAGETGAGDESGESGETGSESDRAAKPDPAEADPADSGSND